jgi:shikimate dehydrogenase
MHITPETKLCAGVGFPMKKSMGVLLHNKLFENENIDAVYLSVEKEDIAEFVTIVRTFPLHLCPVTAPHKQTVMPLLDEIDPAAKEIGAVNTVINRDGVLFGYNTDLAGIAASLKHLDLKNKNVLVLGAGGVAQPVAYYLRSVGAQWYCLNRDTTKAQSLCAKFGGATLESAALESMEFSLIINATSIGTGTQSRETPLEARYLSPATTVFDIVYNPQETRLLREAHERGSPIIGGLGMFIAQALEQERLWQGREFEDRGYTELVQNELTKNK